jgi:hypothetical protein
VRIRVSGTAAFALAFLLLGGAFGHAQLPPPQLPPPPPGPGFVPPYEIMRTVRAAGFDPLAPPLREGTTYVLRANDFRGILMRVVVDARSGAIRDVNRIVPGPGYYGRTFPVSSAYGAMPDDMTPPYSAQPDYGGFEPPPNMPSMPPAFPSRTPTARPVSRAAVTVVPPLPRPRPAELASRKPAGEAKPEVAPSAEAKPDVKSDVTIAAPVAPSTPSLTKPGKAPSSLPIND